MKRQNKIILNGITVILIIFIFIPFLWILFTAFKNRTDILSNTPIIFFKPTFENFRIAFFEKNFAYTFMNSFVISILSTIFSIIIGVPAAYIFSRFKFKFKQDLFLFVLTTRMVPPISIVVPLFLLYAKLDLSNTYLGVILIHTTINSSLVIWIMKSFFDDISRSLDESFLIDGASYFQGFINVILPAARIGILVTGLFCFIMSWNEYLFVSLLTSYEIRPITVAIPGLITPHGTYWGQVAALAITATIPIIIIIFIIRKYLIRALTFGIVK